MEAMLRTANARSASATQWLALGGIIGPLIFVVAFTIGGLLRPGYSPIHQAVSDLGVGPNSWLLNGPLILLFPLLAAFSVGFFRALGPALGDPWRWVCAVLLALPGFGLAWAGVFTEAPATVTLHWVIGFPLVGVGTVVGFTVTGLRLGRLDGWRGFGTYSIVAGAVTLAVMLVMFGTWKSLGIGGAMERTLFIELLAWYVVAGWRLRDAR